MKDFCREVDRVTVKGSKKPIQLFTIDLDFKSLTQSEDRFEFMAVSEKIKTREKEKSDLWSKLSRNKRSTFQIFTSDKDFF